MQRRPSSNGILSPLGTPVHGGHHGGHQGGLIVRVDGDAAPGAATQYNSPQPASRPATAHGSAARLTRKGSTLTKKDRGGSFGGDGGTGSSLEQGEQDRTAWIEERVCSALMLSHDDFHTMLLGRESKAALMSFLDDPACQKVFFYTESDDGGNTGHLMCQLDIPAGASSERRCLCFLKLEETRVSPTDPGKEVTMIDVSHGPLRHLLHVCRDALFPLLSLPQNKRGLTSSAVKEFGFACEEFACSLEILCGQVEGDIILPLPTSFMQASGGGTDAQHREEVRLLESSVLAWVRQIRHTLAKDPEAIMKSREPWPSHALNFWSEHHRNMRCILEQTRAETTLKVFQILKSFGSSYVGPLEKAIADVERCAEEAASNTAYLEALRPHIVPLEDPEVSFDDPPVSFRTSVPPAMHVMYLVTRHSQFYNTPECLSVMIRSLCNLAITRSTQHILDNRGNQVLLEDFVAAHARISTVIKTCEDIIALTNKYKGMEGPGSAAWCSPHTVLFGRLDAFVERCQDLRFVMNQAALYEVFADIQIVGTNGQKSTASAREVHQDMQAALAQFVHVPYNVLDIEVAEFEWSFSAFRTTVKGLDQRAGGLLVQGFEDCSRLEQVAKLFVSFGPLIEGDSFRGHVDRMSAAAVRWYFEDVKRVQSEFVSASLHSEHPVAFNFPPVAGRLSWSKDLLHRIQYPLREITRLQSKLLTQSEEGEQAVQQCRSLTFALKRFDEVTYHAWAEQVNGMSMKVLRQPLIIKREDGVLMVNIDEAIGAVFREGKYMRHMGLVLPSHVEILFDRSEDIRVQASHLGSVVGMYNHLQAVLNDAERNLEGKRLNDLTKLLERGEFELTWQSHGVNNFLEASAQMAQRFHGIITQIKGRVEQIRAILRDWGSKPLFTRNLQRTYSPDDFQSFHKKGIMARYALFREGAEQIQALLEETMATCGANWTMPEWKQYVEHVRDIIAVWLTQFVKDNLSQMCEQLEFDDKLWNGDGLRLVPVPLIEVKMMLTEPAKKTEDVKIIFLPPLESISELGGSSPTRRPNSPKRSAASSPAIVPLQDLVKGWLLSVIDIADCATHSKEEVNYKKKLHADESVQGVVHRINDAVMTSFTLCDQYALNFKSRFAFLWESKPRSQFKKFLDTYGQPPGHDFPVIELFALKIQELEGLMRELNLSDDVQHIRWLRIDVRPFKVAVSNLLESTTGLYTDFLLDFFSEKLVDIHGFIKKTYADLERSVDVTSGSDLAMPVVLVSNRAIRRKREAVENSFEPLSEIVQFLQQHGKPVPGEQVEMVDRLFSEWAQLQKFALQIKDKFSPFIAVDIEVLKTRTAQYVEGEKTVIKDIDNGVFWHFDTLEDPAYDSITGMYREVARFKAERAAIVEQEDLLESPSGLDLSKIDRCEEMLCHAKKMWDTVSCVRDVEKVWKATKWPQVDPMRYLQEVSVFQEQMDDLPEEIRASQLYMQQAAELEALATTLPLLDRMRSPSIRQRHWKQLMEIGQVTFTVTAEMLLEDVLVLPFNSMPDDIASIAVNADKELLIEEMLERVEKVWTDRCIEYVVHETTGIPLVAEKTTDLMNDLEEEQVVLQAILQHRTVAFFYESVIEWQTKLALCETTAKLAIAVQGLWERTQLLFANDPDIRGTHGSAFDLFEATQNDFTAVMNMMKGEPSVLQTCGNSVFTEKLGKQFEDFSRVGQELSSWLQLKRQRFPRFYFLSDTELAVILSEGPVSPKRLTKYLHRIIPGVSKLVYASRMSATGNEVLGLVSSDDEVVSFEEEIGFEMHGRADVCAWFNQVVLQMRMALESSLFSATRKADGSMSDSEAFVKECAQVDIIVSQVMWTAQVESSMDVYENGEKRAFQRLHDRFSTTVEPMFEKVAEANFEGSRAVRRRLQGKLLVRMHQRDVVNVLAALGEKMENSGRFCFAWQSQLRYYLRMESQAVAAGPGGQPGAPEKKVSVANNCRVRIADTTFAYAFEYLAGTEPVFVVNPQTHRMFMSFAVAAHTSMAVVLPPSGGDSRGRTETCRQMGRAFGRPMWTMTCSPHTSAEAVCMRLIGASQTVGGWLLLERFDTMTSSAISVVAMSLKSIILAIRGMSVDGASKPSKGRCFIDGIGLTLQQGTDYFLSFSPHAEATSSTELQLSGIVRPAAMASPDLRMLIDTLLYVAGFRLHATLARRLTSLLTSLTMLLPKEVYYTFGLRLGCSIVKDSANMLRLNKEASEARVVSDAVHHHLEAMLNSRDVHVANEQIDMHFGKPEKHSEEASLPKPTPSIAGKKGLLAGIKSKIKAAASTELHRKAIENAASVKGLRTNQAFFDRASQLESALHVHTSVFVVGPVGAGKSEVWKTLASAGISGRRVKWTAINPNSLPASFLIDHMGKDGKWVPGAVSGVAREIIEMGGLDALRWIVLDGEAVPDWLGLLSSGMCGSAPGQRELRLESGERIALGLGTRMLIECAELSHAAPTSIARSGVVYVSEDVGGVKAITDSWVASLQRQALRTNFAIAFQKHFAKLESFVRTPGLRFIAPTSSISCCLSMIRILDGLIESVGLSGHDEVSCSMMFSFAAVWGYGGALAVDRVLNGRILFHEWWAEEIGQFGGQALKSVGTVFDYYFDIEAREMHNWAELVSPTKFAGKSDIADIVVGTPTQVTTSKLLSLHGLGSSACVVGGPGVGKTSAVLEHLKVLPNTHTYTRIALHSFADSAYLQAKMREVLVKKAGKVIGPPGSRRTVFFVDDLSLPEPDSYGIRSVTALLLQRIAYGAWYERDDLTRTEVVNVQFTAAMRPSYGRSALDPRLMRHFTIVSNVHPDEVELQGIFTSIVGSLLKRFESGTREIIEPLAAATGYAFERITARFLGVQGMYHVNNHTSLHDLSALIKGISSATPEFYSKPENILSLWMYESERVLCDRLESEVDTNIVQSILRESLHRFIEPWEGATDSIRGVLTSVFRAGEKNSHLHAVDPSVGTLAPVSGIDTLKEQLEHKLEAYATTLPALDMRLWDEAIYHVIRCMRIFHSPRGNVILSGQPGIGKTSIVRLAAFVNGHITITPSLCQGYSLSHFRKDLEGVVRLAGVGGQEVVFLISDWEIADPKFLVLLHVFLQGGPVWRLSGEAGEKFDDYAIFDEVTRADIARQWLQRENSEGTFDHEGAESAWNIFVAAAQARLHIALCVTPDALQRIAEAFPALLHLCYIDVVHPWNAKDMLAIASKALEGVKLMYTEYANTKQEAKLRYAVEHHMVVVHNIAASVLVDFAGSLRADEFRPSCSKLSVMTRVFHNTMGKCTSRILHDIEVASDSLKKVDLIVGEASNLKKTRDEVEEQISEKTKTVEDLLVQVGQKSRELEQAGSDVNDAEALRLKAMDKLEAAREDMSVALSMAKPVLATATKVLKTIDKSDLARVKTITSPPAVIEAVLAVTIILSSPPTQVAADVSWTKAKRTMSSIDRYIIELLQIDKEKIPEAHITAASAYMSQGFYNPELVASISTAVASLCEWTIATIEYNRIFTNFVLPKQQALREAQNKLNDAADLKDQQQSVVVRLEEERKALTERFEAASADKNKCQIVFDDAVGMHSRAATLADAVLAQGERLEETHAESLARLQNVVGDSLVCAAIITYGGLLDEEGRERMVSELRKDLQVKDVPFSSDLAFAEIMLRRHEACQMHVDGLPLPFYEMTAPRSIENAIAAEQSTRCAVFVDPDGLASSWMDAKAKRGEAKIVRVSDEGYIDSVKACVSNGDLVVIDMDGCDFDVLLSSLVALRTLKKGKRNFLWVGSEFVECTKLGQIYIRIDANDPIIPAHVRAMTTVINFAVQESEYQDIFLAVAQSAFDQDAEVLRKKVQFEVLQTGIQAHKSQMHVVELMEKVEGRKSTTDENNVSAIHAAANQVEVQHSSLEESLGHLDVSRMIATEAVGDAAMSLSELWRIVKSIFRCDNRYTFSLWLISRLVYRSIRRASKRTAHQATISAGEVTQTAVSTMEVHVLAALAPKHRMPFALLCRFTRLVHEGVITADQMDSFLSPMPLSNLASEAGQPSPSSPKQAEECDDALTPNAANPRLIGFSRSSSNASDKSEEGSASAGRKKPAQTREQLLDLDFSSVAKPGLQSMSNANSPEMLGPANPLSIKSRGIKLQDDVISAAGLSTWDPPAPSTPSVHAANPRDQFRMQQKPDFVSEETWQCAVSMSRIFPGLRTLPGDLRHSARGFRDWCRSERPETIEVPISAASGIEPIELLFLIRALRPDRIPATIPLVFPDISARVDDVTAKYLSRASDDAADVRFQEGEGGQSALDLGTHSFVPIIVVTAQGYDPRHDLKILAEDGSQYLTEVTEVSAAGGKNAAEQVSKTVIQAIVTGAWVVVTDLWGNRDAALAIQRAMDKYSEAPPAISADRPPTSLQTPLGFDLPFQDIHTRVHRKGRVFIIVPHQLPDSPGIGIPTALIRRSIKVVDSMPSGLKAKHKRLLRAIENGSDATREPPKGSVLEARYALCLVHALCMQRNVDGPRGWVGGRPRLELHDLTFACGVIEALHQERKLAGAPGKGWNEEAEFMITHVIYGGIPVDERDQTLIQALGRAVWGEDTLLEREPISMVELPLAWGEGGGDNDIEQEEYFMPCMWGLLELVPREATWRERQELLRDVLDDLSHSIPPGNFDLSLLEMAALAQGETRLPDFDLDMGLRGETSSTKGSKQALAPLMSILIEEATVMNKLIRDIQHMLQDCEAAILRGSSFCNSSPWVQATAQCILEGHIPPEWAAILPGSSTSSLSDWVIDLQQRASQLKGFADFPPVSFPLTWLAGFRRPRSVVAAAHMYIAWRDSIPSHRLKIIASVSEYEDANCVLEDIEGHQVLIHGVHVHGARWDATSGSFESAPIKQACACPLPVLELSSSSLSMEEKEEEAADCLLLGTPDTTGSRPHPASSRKAQAAAEGSGMTPLPSRRPSRAVVGWREPEGDGSGSGNRSAPAESESEERGGTTVGAGKQSPGIGGLASPLRAASGKSPDAALAASKDPLSPTSSFEGGRVALSSSTPPPDPPVDVPLYQCMSRGNSFVCDMTFEGSTPGLDEMLFLLGGVALVLQQGDVSDEEFRGGRKPQAGSFFDVSGPPISKSFIKMRTHRKPPPPPPQ